MSINPLLRDLGLPAQLLLQFAARQEHVPVSLVAHAPLLADPVEAGQALLERGLLETTELDGVLALTPMGLALRDEVLGRWPAFHARARAKLVSHVVAEHDLGAGTLLRAAIEAVDRAAFVPEPARCLCDLDLPVPTGIGRMTTSAPHALIAILRAVQPIRGERVLVCGAKAGMTMALSAHMVGEAGEVVGLDWDGRTVDLVQRSLAGQPELGDRIHVVGQRDVTVPPRDDGRSFDVIVMNGSVPKIPWPLVERLHPDGGRLLLFLQEPEHHGQSCYVLYKDRDIVRDEHLSRFVFTPIYGRFGWDSVTDLQTRWAAARAQRGQRGEE